MVTVAGSALAQGVIVDVLELRHRRDYTPMKLRPAIENLQGIHRVEDAQALDHALQELAVSALATMERIRAACPDIGGPPA
jgi:hypothetical protein